MLKDLIRNALIRAIKDFISQDEIFTKEFVESCAQDWVYEHDEEVRDHLRENCYLVEEFFDALNYIDYDDIF